MPATTRNLKLNGWTKSTNKKGISFALSYDDKIFYSNVISVVSVKKLSRLWFLLETAEITKIYSYLSNPLDVTGFDEDGKYKLRSNKNETDLFKSESVMKLKIQKLETKRKVQDETSPNFYNVRNETESINNGMPLSLDTLNIHFSNLKKSGGNNISKQSSQESLAKPSEGKIDNISELENEVLVGPCIEKEQLVGPELTMIVENCNSHHKGCENRFVEHDLENGTTATCASINIGETDYSDNVIISSLTNVLKHNDTEQNVDSEMILTVEKVTGTNDVITGRERTYTPLNNAETVTSRSADKSINENLNKISHDTEFFFIEPVQAEKTDNESIILNLADTTHVNEQELFPLESPELKDFSPSESEYVPPTDSSDDNGFDNLFIFEKEKSNTTNTINVDENIRSMKTNRQEIRNPRKRIFPSSSDSDGPSTSKPTEANRNKSKRTLRKKRLSSRERSYSSSSFTDDASEPSDIFVNCTKKTDAGKRVYDKHHNCYFCNKLVCKIARHLENVHSNEIEVAKLLALNSGDERRREGFLCILRAGDYFHNCEVLALKTGELILSRRPRNSELQAISYKSYGPCPHCLGFFLLSTLWHHVKLNCPKKKPAIPQINDALHGTVTRRDLRGESIALLGNSLNEYSSDYMKNIVSAFKDDDISDVCKNDELIMKYGLLLYEKYNRHQYEYIRQSMRQLGRLVLAIQTVKLSKQTLQESLLPKNYDILIMAVKHLCLSQRTEIHQQDYGIPSLALKLGHSLRKCALVARGIALRKGDLHIERQMEAFLDLMTIEWNSKVSSAALRTLRQKKMNSPELLPLTDDLITLNKYLETIMQEFTKNIGYNFNPQHWARLASATLCRVILFNKRRSGEASRMTINQYASRPNWKEQSTSELKATLTPMENNLANRLTVVEVVGKSRALTKVPILLTLDMKNAIDKLIETRIPSGISKNNIYVFARSNQSEGYLRGHDSLRVFCNEANLQKPRLITSTKLRKYIATVVQMFDLKEIEYDWLARHLGHDIRVHREFYRLHESAVELTKVSRILLAVDKGEANAFSGKSLEDINVTDLPDVEDSDVSSDNECCADNNTTGTNSKLSVINDCSQDARENLNLPLTKSNSHSTSDNVNARKTRKRVTERKSADPVRKPSIKRPWETEEKGAVLEFFRSNIRHGIVPKKAKIEECLQQHDNLLQERSWRDIKYCVYNQIQLVKKKKL